jgi:hypothetical protein
MVTCLMGVWPQESQVRLSENFQLSCLQGQPLQ